MLQISASPIIATSILKAKEDLAWIQAIDDQILALHKNKTWILVEQNNKQNVLTHKWVFKHKLDEMVGSRDTMLD